MIELSPTQAKMLVYFLNEVEQERDSRMCNDEVAGEAEMLTPEELEVARKLEAEAFGDDEEEVAGFMDNSFTRYLRHVIERQLGEGL